MAPRGQKGGRFVVVEGMGAMFVVCSAPLPWCWCRDAHAFVTVSTLPGLLQHECFYTSPGPQTIVSTAPDGMQKAY